jgi:hypothetical protein
MNAQAKVEKAIMPARLLSPEGEAWMLRCKLLKQAFDDRDNGRYFRRCGEIEEAYADLSPKEFVEQWA